MRSGLRSGLAALALAAGLIGVVPVSAHAESAGGDPASAGAPKCLKAEVNPVTGHVLCIDPIGAPVDPPPAVALPPCKPDERSDAAWTWGPKCKS